MNNISQITADQVQKAINEKKDIILLDVKTPGEYSPAVSLCGGQRNIFLYKHILLCIPIDISYPLKVLIY